MSDLIERKSIRNMYSCLDPEEKVRVAQVLTDIDAIPPAEPSWADALAELHEQFSALEKEIRRASAEMSAVIREYVDRPKEGKWIETCDTSRLCSIDRLKCSECGAEYLPEFAKRYDFCPKCGADMREREDE